MEILWGAWVKFVNQDNNKTDIVGIYDTIRKEKRGDFPFTTNLKGIIAYQASQSESNKNYDVSLVMMDLDHPICNQKEQLTIEPIIDMPCRRYFEFELHNVGFSRTGAYQLSILIGDDEKQIIPLWVIAPKMTIENLDDGSHTEEWAEQ